MEPIYSKSCESSFCKDEKVEAMDLLEECWFFENLLTIKPRVMPRCYSDPCPSSTGLISQDYLLGKDSDFANYSSTSKPPNNSASVHPHMIQRAPTMPPIRVREDDDKKASNFTRSKLVDQPSVPIGRHDSSDMKAHHKSECKSRKCKLLRTPSLPPYMGRSENFQATDHRTGRSPKQPSTQDIDILPPRQTSKSRSIPRYRPARNIDVENINGEGVKEMRRRYLNQRTKKKGLGDLEYEEVQGFKDLGFSFEKET